MISMYSIMGNSQKLDGGAMFGNVPKAIWSKWIEPDHLNRIPLACRALLVQDGEKNILLETGIGAFFEPKLQERYGVVESHHVLLDSLQKINISENDIDFIILSHLHFDHAGGLLSVWQEEAPLKLLFPNAKYLVSKIAWERACEPHARDKASFIPILNQFLANSNRLVIVDNEYSHLLGNQYKFNLTHGHTPGLLHTTIQLNKEESILFASDLIPGVHWVHLPISMGYDRAPELLIDEKKIMLEYAIKKNAQIFYTHDAKIAASHIAKENDKFIAVNKINSISNIVKACKM